MKRVFIGLLVGCLSLPALGQAGPGGGGGFGARRGQQITPQMIQQYRARAQQRQMDNIKQQLNCTDDEFAALQPYIQKVMDLQTQLQINRAARFRPRGQNTNTLFNQGAAPTDIQQAMAELGRVVNDQTATAQVIHLDLEELRDARGRIQAELTSAQSTLRQLLTLRQEGTLVLDGLLN